METTPETTNSQSLSKRGRQGVSVGQVEGEPLAISRAAFILSLLRESDFAHEVYETQELESYSIPFLLIHSRCLRSRSRSFLSEAAREVITSLLPVIVFE